MSETVSDGWRLSLITNRGLNSIGHFSKEKKNKPEIDKVEGIGLKFDWNC